MIMKLQKIAGSGIDNMLALQVVKSVIVKNMRRNVNL